MSGVGLGRVKNALTER